MTTSPSGPAGVTEVRVTEVPGDGYLLDVREVAEWVEGHPPAAVLIPMSTIVARVDEIPRDRRVHVICRSGNRSGQVAAWLRAQDHDAVNVLGGMIDWVAAGLPVVAGE